MDKKWINCSPNEKLTLGVFSRILNLLIFALMIALIIVILKELYSLFVAEIFGGDSIMTIVDSLLFILILIELFTIMNQYLLKGYIKVERIVEVGIISIVRDLVFHILDLEPMKIFSLSAVLLVFGGIFFIEKKFSSNRNVE